MGTARCRVPLTLGTPPRVPSVLLGGGRAQSAPSPGLGRVGMGQLVGVHRRRDAQRVLVLPMAGGPLRARISPARPQSIAVALGGQ